jgi:hypothetical protein
LCLCNIDIVKSKKKLKRIFKRNAKTEKEELNNCGSHES